MEEDAGTDEQLLEQMRAKRWDDNARWQLNTFAQSQLGAWTGSLELYDSDGSGGVRLVPVEEQENRACRTTASVCATNTLELVDDLPAVASHLSLSAQLGVQDFRPERGNMAVAEAFSLAAEVAAMAPSVATGWLIELALREDARRVRCKLLYRDDGEAGMGLRSLAVIREAEGGCEFIDGDADAARIDGRPGRGLYDPPPGDKIGSAHPDSQPAAASSSPDPSPTTRSPYPFPSPKPQARA